MIIRWSNLQIKFIFSLLVFDILLINSQVNAGLIDSIKCKNDTAIIYSFYIPEMLNQYEKLIYIMDPGGRVSLAMQKFKKVSDEQGYLLVCSYSSTNGPIKFNEKIFAHVIEDIKERYNSSLSNLILAGFSGGSRAAFAIAKNNNHLIDGVIACGSALPANTIINKKLEFLYTGIIGVEDMNFYEMYDLSITLDQTESNSHFIYFKGGHSWPPEQSLSMALKWISMQMNDNLEKKTEELINQQFDQYKNTIEQYNQFLESQVQLKVYENFIKTFKGSENIKPYLDSVNILKQNPVIKKNIKRFHVAKNTFYEEQKKYIDAFRKVANYEFRPDDIQNESWWVREVRFINGLVRKKDLESTLLGKRLFDFIWRMCAERGYIAFNNENYKSTIEFDRIWKIIQTDSYYPYLRSAKSYLELLQPEMAITELKYAIKKGFSNIQYLQENYSGLIGDKKFDKLLMDQ